MDQEKILTFEAFARKAAKKLEDRKTKKKKMLYIGALDEQIEIRALSDQEISECMEYSEDDFTNDKYTMYYASRTLQELAGYMIDNGMIKEHLEVCDAVSSADRKKIVHEILALSGVYDETTVKELDEVKN